MPLDSLKEQNCNEEYIEQVIEHCSIDDTISNPLMRQYLYDVYVHALPGFCSFPKESIFYERDIAKHVEVSFLLSQKLKKTSCMQLH